SVEPSGASVVVLVLVPCGSGGSWVRGPQPDPAARSAATATLGSNEAHAVAGPAPRTNHPRARRHRTVCRQLRYPRCGRALPPCRRRWSRVLRPLVPSVAGGRHRRMALPLLLAATADVGLDLAGQ